MKNKKLSILIFVLFIIALIASLVYSSNNEDGYEQGDVLFQEVEDIPATSTPIPTPRPTETPDEVTPVPTDVPIVEDPIEWNSKLYVSEENLQEVIVELFKLDSSNTSVLGSLPLTEAYFNKLLESKRIIPTVSSGSTININKIGVDGEGSFMVMFNTQSSSYYIVGTIVDDKIDSITYRELE